MQKTKIITSQLNVNDLNYPVILQSGREGTQVSYKNNVFKNQDDKNLDNKDISEEMVLLCKRFPFIKAFDGVFIECESISAKLTRYYIYDIDLPETSAVSRNAIINEISKFCLHKRLKFIRVEEGVVIENSDSLLKQIETSNNEREDAVLLTEGDSYYRPGSKNKTKLIVKTQ